MRSAEVDRGPDRKLSFFGRPEGFGSSELDEIVDFDTPDRMELVAGSDYNKNTDV